MADLNLLESLASTARVLAERLREGRVPRSNRAAARDLLVKAFDAVNRGDGTIELLRRVDALAAPLVPRIPTHRRPIGVAPVPMMLSARLIGRILAYDRRAERLVGRIDAFLRATGLAPLKPFLREPLPGGTEGVEVELELTRG